MNKEEIKKIIVDYLSTKSSLVKSEVFSETTEIFSEGILDSLAFVELIVFVEEMFHVDLSAAGDINRDTFGSVEKIVTIIASLKMIIT